MRAATPEALESPPNAKSFTAKIFQIKFKKFPISANKWNTLIRILLIYKGIFITGAAPNES